MLTKDGLNFGQMLTYVNAKLRISLSKGEFGNWAYLFTDRFKGRLEFCYEIVSNKKGMSKEVGGRMLFQTILYRDIGPPAPKKVPSRFNSESSIPTLLLD